LPRGGQSQYQDEEQADVPPYPFRVFMVYKMIERRKKM
jgi:hypothetical protein